MSKYAHALLRIRSRFQFSKRRQFVGTTLILTVVLMATQLVSSGIHPILLLGLVTLSYVMSFLVLRENLSGWAYVTTLTLPAYYSGAVYLFYLLLPTRWLTRLPIAMLYSVGIYAILLTENIYNVAAERNIQLLRAAHSVGFLLTLLTTFFLFDTVVSLHLPFYLNMLLTLVIVFPLELQALWSMELTPGISRTSLIAAACITLLMVEL
ncbi:MAG: hypothetical protein AAB874_03655, partial [Patescibacteria group bacterium]